MRKCLVSFWFLLIPFVLFAQEDRRNVMQSDISGVYKNSVRKGFFHELNRNYGLSRGYHGMLDFGYTIGCGDYEFDRCEINTAHGYQFNPYVFVGGGFGLHFMSEYYTDEEHLISLNHRDKGVDVPIFANVRATFIERNITPFAEIRGGYYLTHSGGAYVNMSAGCRFSTWGRQAVILSVGYTYSNLHFDSFDGFDKHKNSRKLGTSGISIKIVYEF